MSPGIADDKSHADLPSIHKYQEIQSQPLPCQGTCPISGKPRSMGLEPLLRTLETRPIGVVSKVGIREERNECTRSFWDTES